MPYLLLFKLGAVVVLAIAAYFAWEKIVADPYRKEGEAKIQPQLDAALAANQQCGASVADLTGKLKGVNDDVDKLHADSKAAQDAAAKRLAQANAQAAKNKVFIASLEALLDQPATADPNESCPATDAILRDLAQRRVRFFADPGTGGADGGGQGAGTGSLRIQ